MPKRTYWTRERIFEALAAWEKEHKSLPTSTDWRKASDDPRGPDSYPTSRHVANVFGGWSEALDAYSNTSRPKKRWKIWSEEEIIQALQDWAETHDGWPPTYKNLSHGNHEGALPSMTSINRRFGSYREALAAAGLKTPMHGVTYRSILRFRPLPRRGDRDAV